MGAVSDVVRTSLGAYLLGALNPADRAEVERHLTGCRSCRDELASIAGLPGLLSRLDLAQLVPGGGLNPAPDPGALDRTLTELGRRRHLHRTRRRRSSVAVAAVLLAAGAGAGAFLAERHDPGRVRTSADPVTGATASVSLLTHRWGTEIGVQLHHVPVGTHCQLVAVDRAGRRQTIGAWQADYEGGARITAASDLPLAELASLEIVTSQGGRLVSVATT